MLSYKLKTLKYIYFNSHSYSLHTGYLEQNCGILRCHMRYINQITYQNLQVVLTSFTFTASLCVLQSDFNHA